MRRPTQPRRRAPQCLVYAAAGLPPDWLLPVVVDVGTENEELRERDPLYVGLQQRRLRGDAYYAVMEVGGRGAGGGGVKRGPLGRGSGGCGGTLTTQSWRWGWGARGGWGVCGAEPPGLQ
jgi:hypothetical protein